ncbi:MAG TPA: phosphatidylserine decarboxylase [Micromonosporaceae bacterium]
MSENLSQLGDRLLQARISPTTASALVADFVRHPGPKHGLVVGAGPDSPVVTCAIDALTPQDSLTVVAGAEADQVRAQIRQAGAWVEQRVRVAETLVEVDPADAVILADIASGSADDLRAELDALAKHLNPGGAISVAVPAAAFLGGGAAEELDRQAALHGVGSDLVLRNVPPVRVHRLRYTPADTALAERLAPMARTSSVRLTSDMHLDSNGIAAAAICLSAAAMLRRRRSRLWLLPALAAAPVAAFFRDPQRAVPTDPAAIVAASDGSVLSVERIRDERLGDEEFLRIAVFLSVLDVHINRAPVAGRVVDHFVVDGGFAAAMKPAAEHNVAAYTVLDTTRGTVAVAQRTGLIARRIVHRAPVGTLLAKGERFGLIRFGSRTDVYLPTEGAMPMVSPGERVVGGETVIARWTA